ncbi:unnamed protein product [Phytophthora lilii]|uniref:Unnamed protein product n=1 Tax=Phytophthora lilii TaxID=2077276 RepID=A0A9W6X7H0_9STRA|nr:unnamed protein product [Phytophthora lilii]
MVPISLQCAVVGDAGSSFDVEIDDGAKVDKLKKAIWEEIKEKFIHDVKSRSVVASDLQLYLAKKGDWWLPSNELAALQEEEAETPVGFEKVPLTDATWSIHDVLEEMKMPNPGTRQIHVLVEAPKGELKSKIFNDVLTRIQEENARRFHDWMEEMREQDRKRLDQLKRTIERALLPAAPSKSDLQLGQDHLNLLLKVGCVSNAEETVGADPFWSVEVQAQVDCIQREDAFDAFITPYFSNALDSHDVVFVNSELYKWLPQSTYGNSNAALKPDGFVTHRGMYHMEPEPNDDVSRVGNSFRFGKADKALFDCLVLFESSITNHLGWAPFGQVVRYMQHLFPRGLGSTVLFNRTTFWLINSINGVVVRGITATWVMEGSKALFRDFITKNLSPWVTRLTAACSALNVEVVEGDAFLGRGAFGRVFKVKRKGQDGDVLALKIVEMSSVGRLFQEEDALVRAQHTGLTIRRVGTATGLSDGAAMLLSPVGEPLSYPTTSQEVKALFDMLWQLHSAGVAHGDPRVPNVIVKDGQRLWIDLVEWWGASPSLLMQNDARILTQSILHGFPEDSPDLELEALINEYGARPTRANLDLLASRVSVKLALTQSDN